MSSQPRRARLVPAVREHFATLLTRKLKLVLFFVKNNFKMIPNGRFSLLSFCFVNSSFDFLLSFTLCTPTPAATLTLPAPVRFGLGDPGPSAGLYYAERDGFLFVGQLHLEALRKIVVSVALHRAEKLRLFGCVTDQYRCGFGVKPKVCCLNFTINK